MKAYLALGSNLGDRLGNIREALRLLSGQVRVVKASSIYETPAMYYTAQGDFYNAVAEIETDLASRALLKAAQAVEKALKRRRSFKNSPRTIDVDILFYGREVLAAPGLHIPHPKLAERPFVLAPLCEIAPRLRHPVTGATVSELLRACPGAAFGARRLPANYGEALTYLNSLAPSGLFSTAPVRNALKALANPQDSFSAVHVAGTNGKGSVCAMLAGALNRAGRRTGLYLSPHINSPRERISLGGHEIPESDFFRLFGAVKSYGFRLSYFEYLTAIAFLWFREQKVSFAVVETGLGGRLDATNVFKKSLAVITNISFEHAAALGGTLESIARHKAGIIKAGCPAVTSAEGKPLAIIKRRAAAARSPLALAGPDERIYSKGAEVFYRGAAGARPLKLALKGSFQAANAVLALKALEVLRATGARIPAASAAAGLAAARLEGRFEIVKTGGADMIFDGAHNPAALAALFAALEQAGLPRPVTLAALMNDKQVGRLVNELCDGSRTVVFSPVNSPRAWPPEDLDLFGRAAGFKNTAFRPGAAAALALARRLALKHGAPLLITGSFYLAAEMKALINKKPPPVFPRELAPAAAWPEQ